MQGSEVAVGCDAVEGGCVTQPVGGCPEGADFYLETSGKVGLYLRPTDRNGNCLAGNGGGSISVQTTGPLELRNGVSVHEFNGDCTQDGLATQPLAEPYHFILVDNREQPNEGDAPKPPEAGTIEVVIDHNQVNGGTRQTRLFFNTCHFPPEPVIP